MGRTGSALDNAVAESFNSTLEWELLCDNHFHTRKEARREDAASIDDYKFQGIERDNDGSNVDVQPGKPRDASDQSLT